jgi:hypothetical protein
MEFSAELGVESEGNVTLVVYEYPTSTKAVQLASEQLRLQPGEASRHAIRFQTSAGRDRAAIHVYLPEAKGSTLRMTNARLGPAE